MTEALTDTVTHTLPETLMIALMRMPCEMYSSAAVLVRPITPCLAAT